MCDKETIEKFKNRFEELAERYKEAYQCTGENRHYSLWQRYGDLYDICNLASLNDEDKTATAERKNYKIPVKPALRQRPGGRNNYANDIGEVMKFEHEVKRIDGICMNLKNILDVVFPDRKNEVFYDNEKESITVNMDGKKKIVNVEADSVKAVLVDIAVQFLAEL